MTLHVLPLPSPHYSRPQPQPPSIAGRVPPHDLDCEAALLGALMLEPAAAVPTARRIVSPQDFFSESNNLICQAIYAQYDACKLDGDAPIVLISGWLRDREQLAAAGGSAYLGQLVSGPTPRALNVETYATIVAGHSRVRRVQQAMHRRLAESYGDVGPDKQAWIEAVEAELATIARATVAGAAATGGEAVAEAVDGMAAALDRGDNVTGARTGIAKLDEETAGLQRGDLVLVTGKLASGPTTGCGKTAFAINTVGLTIAGDGLGVGVFSLEDPCRRIGSRIAATVARIDAGKLRKPKTLLPTELVELRGAADYVQRRLPIRIDDRRQLGLTAIRARSLEWRNEFTALGTELRLIVVDNLQRAGWHDPQQMPNARDTNDTQAASRFAMGLNELAEETGATVILVSQLNQVGHIKGCSAVEEHAQLWLHVERNDKALQDGREPAHIRIRKARDGAADEPIPLWWHGQYLLFSESQWINGFDER